MRTFVRNCLFVLMVATSLSAMPQTKQAKSALVVDERPLSVRIEEASSDEEKEAVYKEFGLNPRLRLYESLGLVPGQVVDEIVVEVESPAFQVNKASDPETKLKHKAEARKSDEHI